MKKILKIFCNVKKEQEWLSSKKGWKLVNVTGMWYTFEESSQEFNYEYIFFDKNKKELESIKEQIIDEDIEFVCKTSTRALFRKDASRGEIQVYVDTYKKYSMLMKQYHCNLVLALCYLTMGSTQTIFILSGNSFFSIAMFLFYQCSSMYFVTATSLKQYASELDEGNFVARLKKEGIPK